jgi:carbonic anhydrase
LRERIEKGCGALTATIKNEGEKERKDERVEEERVIKKGHNAIAVIAKDERERIDEKVEKNQRVERGHNTIVVATRDERKERQES